MCIEIKDNAIFIADAHYDENNEGFLEFLDFLDNNDISQVFLLGDIFNILIGGLEPSYLSNKIVIDKINTLAKKFEIYYFEGNHDFNIKQYFPNVKIIEKQPVLGIYKNHLIALSHGDIFLPFFTQQFLKILRNKCILKIILIINKLLNNKIYTSICKRQKVKKLDYKIIDYLNIAKSRILSYCRYFKKLDKSIELIIEGHFHQDFNCNFNGVKYYNLNSFANERSFFILECSDQIRLRKINLLEKEL